MPTDPATVQPLTDAEVEALWNGARGILKEWREYPWNTFEKPMLGKVARAAYALAASRVDTTARERAAASKAWDAAMSWACTAGSDMDRDRYLAREYPAPRECVKCEGCGGPMNDDGPFTTHGVGDCIKFLAAKVKQLEAVR